MTTLLTLDRISCAFTNVQALCDVSLTIQVGTLHALVGENGAGKSTLIKIIAGALQPDAGTMTFNGRPYRPCDPREALQAGIATLYQEPYLLPTRSVAANIALGQEPTHGPWLQWRAARALARDMLFRLHATHIEVEALVEQLPLSDRQLVALAHALVQHSQVLILDEPTASLNHAEAQALRDVLWRLKTEGVTIIYVSHRLPEVFELADVVTVLRDGQQIYTGPIDSLTPDQLIVEMLGHQATRSFPTRRAVLGPVVLSVEGVTRRGLVENVSFELHAGEIVALTGMTGSGMKELGEALFGDGVFQAGTVRLLDRPVHLTPATALRHGIGYLPGDRAEGLLADLPIRRNIVLPILSKLTNRWGVLNRSSERQAAQQIAQRLQIKAPSLDLPVRILSGGNQQKVALAKWLASDARILILIEPTQGVDVGTRFEFYEQITALTREGLAVLLISSDTTEVLGLAHRVLVLRGGRVVAELDGDPTRAEEVVRYALGTQQSARRALT